MPRPHFIAPLLLLALCLPARGQSNSALINEALDKLVDLDLNQPLPQALQAIEEKTAVPLKVQSAVWELLPWGEQTNVSATIKGKTLREALGAITQKLGLTFVLKEEAVEIRPLPALARLGRRSTVQELQALDVLHATPLALDTDRPTIAKLLAAVDAKLVESKAPFAIENRAGTMGGDIFPDNENTAVFVARNATLADALEAIDRDTKATWYPWGKTIVVVAKEDHFRNQLRKTITTRYNGVDISQVLTELSQRSGVPFAIEPGAVQRVPPEFRTVRLVLQDAPIQQALESIAGFTGLGYIVNEKGVYVWNQSAAPGAGGAGGRDPVIGMLPLDNGVQILIKESQVPPDVREYLKSKTTKAIDNIRQMMQEEGFKPTPPPVTTQPAETDQDL